jgi:hypothetical protein
MTLEIKQLIKKRQRLYKAGKQDAYSAAAVKVNREIYRRKRLYYRRKYPATSLKWWTLVNDTRSEKPSPVADLSLANSLNDGFYSVWNGSTQPCLTEYINAKCLPRKEPIFTEANVSASLKCLDGCSPGPDELSANLLRSSRLEVCGVITFLFNLFLTKGFVPDQWKNAHITPIAKVDHPTAWSDYRPISLTSNLCKTFERVIAKLIIEHTAHI